MSYRKPFTPEQRQDAIRVFRSICKSFDDIRHRYRPRTLKERESARLIRNAIKNFGETLQEPNDKLDVYELNAAKRRASDLILQYVIGRTGDQNR